MLMPLLAEGQMDTAYRRRVDANFEKAYAGINAMLEGTKPLSFKRAVFLVENAYDGDSLSEDAFNGRIWRYKQLVLTYARSNRLADYYYADSSTEVLNAALFRVFTDTIWGQEGKPVSLPFQYNFEDALGEKNYANTFVSTLMATKRGNCHSMPFLYKILTEELGTKAYLAFAPMHIYIKQRNKYAGWYNVELTSGQYPKDAYLISSGFISQQSIQSGLYMDTLSLRASIAVCLLDLGHAYERKVGYWTNPSFTLRCAERVLEVKPNHASSLLVCQRMHHYSWIKARKRGMQAEVERHKKAYAECNRKLLGYGYENVSEETFRLWYTGYKTHKSEYANPAINSTFKIQE